MMLVHDAAANIGTLIPVSLLFVVDLKPTEAVYQPVLTSRECAQHIFAAAVFDSFYYRKKIELAAIGGGVLANGARTFGTIWSCR